MVESLSPYTGVDTGMEKIEETEVNFFACYVATVVKTIVLVIPWLRFQVKSPLMTREWRK